MPRLISKRQAADVVGYHPEHIMRLARVGQFPQPVKLGAGVNSAVRFVAEEVETWISSRLSSRATEAGLPVLGDGK
jgi:predicted DNA-binding transcriptional regulator AlpA